MEGSGAVVLNQGQLCTQGTSGSVSRHLDGHDFRGAKNPSMHRTAPDKKELSNPKCHSAEAKEGWFQVAKIALQ